MQKFRERFARLMGECELTAANVNWYMDELRAEGCRQKRTSKPWSPGLIVTKVEAADNEALQKKLIRGHIGILPVFSTA